MVDLATGRVTIVGEIGGGSTVRGLAVPAAPPAPPGSTPTPEPTPSPTPTQPPGQIDRFFVYLPIVRR
jgi:hypothetical protein